MSIIKYRPTSSGTRHGSRQDFTVFDTAKPLKSLTRIKKKTTGRNNTGKITIRHRGGAQKRRYRLIDFKRNKLNIPGKVSSIEYDPNRGAHIALVVYADGDKRYILAPEGLKAGASVLTADTADIDIGNTMTLKHIPIGTPIHNLEIVPKKGGQLVRGAGAAALIQSKDTKYATVLLPSKEIRLFSLDCYATIGQVSNLSRKIVSLGKAGRKRLMGWRPSVRGIAMHPDAHPHGGGEGRSGIGMPSPKSPWGKPTLGKKTRNKKKYSAKYIIRDRRQK